MKVVFFFLAIVSAIMLWTGCGINPIEYDNTMLDGPAINDTNYSYRLSIRSDVSLLDTSMPVIICVHGYGACTYEWEEFRRFTIEDGRSYTSLILLGAHGKDIEDFIGSTWEQWQQPIMEEYRSLVNLNFKKISFAGSSTGATLVLELISRNVFDSQSVKPQWFFFVDPIIVPSNKLLTMVNIVGPILGNAPIDNQTAEEKAHWYRNRPAETLKELFELTELIRKRLERGISLPAGSFAKTYKSAKDESADPVGALLIYKGLSTNEGNKTEVEMIDSDLHVFTRLQGRASLLCSAADTLNQKRVFEEMIDKVTKTD